MMMVTDSEGNKEDARHQRQEQPQPELPNPPPAATCPRRHGHDNNNNNSNSERQGSNDNNNGIETESGSLLSWRRRRRRTTSPSSRTSNHSIRLLAEELRSHLDEASSALIQTLLDHLRYDDGVHDSHNNDSSTSTTNNKGLSLPASAVAWLSLQLFPPTEEQVLVDDGDVWRQQLLQQEHPPIARINAALRQRLLNVLPMATRIRLTAEEWPPLTGGDNTRSTRRRRRRLRKLQQSLREVLHENVTAENENNNDDSASNNFLNYYHSLMQHPQVDVRVFPACQVLLLDQVPPTRIHNLHVLQQSLEVLRIERSSLESNNNTNECLSNFFFLAPSPHRVDQDDSGNAARQQDPLATATTPTNDDACIYSKLTHVKISHCSLTGYWMTPRRHPASSSSATPNKSPRPIVWTRHLPYLQSLCLTHNQLSLEAAALAGLSQLPRLVKLDLSYNQLTMLRRAHYRLGNIQTLLLSHNQLTTAEGIDRLYALQTLWLDHNCIADLAAVSGLARLPELQSLRLEGNPLEKPHAQQQQHGQRSDHRNLPVLSSSSSSMLSLYRIQVFDLFRQRRPLPSSATYRDWQSILPQLDGKPASLAEMKVLKEQTFMAPILPDAATTVIDVSVEAGICERPLSDGLVVPRRPASQRRRRRQEARMDQPMRYVAVDPLLPQDNNRDLATSSSTTTAADFTLGDVLQSLCELQEQEEEQEEEEETEQDNVENIEKNQETATGVANRRDRESMIRDEATLLEVDRKDGELFARRESVDDDDFLCRENSDELLAKTDALPSEIQDKLATRPEGESTLVDGLVSRVEAEEKKDPAGFEGLSVSPIRASDSKSLTMGTTTSSAEMMTPFESDTAGTDVLSLPGASVATDTSIDLPSFDGIAPPYARRHVSDVSETPSSNSPGRLPISLSGIMSSEDHSSLHSSNGTPRRDDASSLRRFQLAEENSTFEGPDAYKNVRVHMDLELYFRLFVFPPSKDDEQSASADGDEEPEWRLVLQRFPRIQVWPIDRRLWDQADKDSPNIGSPEEFRRIWKEKVVACGKSALRRLTPNRGARFGFHGELLWADADSSRLKLETVAECRKVIVCCSNKSLYFILDHDKVTVKSREQKRKFPLAIPLEARFKDAIWPHALARHPFSTLRVITIGFGFQRLTLRFGKSGTPSEEDFTYILLTSSKGETVSLLKEFQDLSHDCRTAMDRFALPKDGLLIDNDDRHVLDALGVSVAPDVLGVVLHYQILEQRWRRGERGNVRRVCVLTDGKIYLLDEDYVGDGSESFEAGARQLGETVYRLVDSAPLSLVAQVQAADADPNTITIVIRAASRFQRSHNWRLVCRDRHGAERLVEDVRRATSSST